jgi:hypothetical protein
VDVSGLAWFRLEFGWLEFGWLEFGLHGWPFGMKLGSVFAGSLQLEPKTEAETPWQPRLTKRTVSKCCIVVQLRS